jgi:choline-sulfatase
MNLIIITLDACRLDHLTFSGYYRDTSPNLNEISKDGALFLNTRSVIPQSDPALVSILTGLYPHNHGIRTLGTKKSLSVTTLHGLLKSRGYKTACISIEQEGNDSIKKGFDEFNLLRWRVKNKIKTAIKKLFDKNTISGASGTVTNIAIDWIKRNKKSSFFLYLHYMELHWPYAPPKPFDSIFDADYKGGHSFNDLDDGKIKRGDMLFNNNLSEEERNHAIAHYDGGILYMDSQIWRFVQFLKDEKLWDNSIVIVVGDHGEHLGEHNFYYQHVASIYEPSLKVPLFIHAPGLKGKRITTLTQTVDIMPTVLDILGIPIDTSVDGKSLIPLIEGKADKVRDYAFAESGVSLFKQNTRKYIDGVEGKWRMITDGEWKLIYMPHPENDIYELYHISVDPEERSNQIENEKIIADSLKQKLFQWMGKKYTNEAESEPYKGNEEDKVKQRLRRLGYID